MRIAPRRAASWCSEPGSAAPSRATKASCSRSVDPLGASGSTWESSHGTTCRPESSLSSTGGLATATSTTSAGSIRTLW